MISAEGLRLAANVEQRRTGHVVDVDSSAGKGSAADSLVEIVDEFLPAYTPVVE